MFPIGGLVGIVCGGIARSKGDGSLGLVAIVAGVISFFASFWVAFLVLARPRRRQSKADSSSVAGGA